MPTGPSVDVAGSDLRHHFWLEWQRLNTPSIENGSTAACARRIKSHLVTLPLQFHVVHEGGAASAFDQEPWPIRPRRSPPAPSSAGAIGGRYPATLEVFALGSRHVPDRSRPELSSDGKAFFGRAAAERSGWRGHVIFWRGRNFMKDEGDANYLSVAEWRSIAAPATTRKPDSPGGLRLRVRPCSTCRDIRVEGQYRSSSRITSVVSAFWKIR